MIVEQKVRFVFNVADRVQVMDRGAIIHEATGDEARADCPIVGSYGGRDLSLRGAAERLDRALQAAGVDHDVKEYPDAGHGFLNDHARGEVPKVFAVMGKMVRTAYHEPSARDARRGLVAFFDKHLKS